VSKVRESARGENCTFRIPGVCNCNPETTVYCHTNRLKDGKGMGIKSKKGAYGCSCCHDVVDGRRPRPEGMSVEQLDMIIDRAVSETDALLISKGLPIIDEPAKRAMRTALKLKKGGHSRWGKRALVSQWAKDMKAALKAKK
jgi:hypothetical protein